jgi:hypothetical protein
VRHRGDRDVARQWLWFGYLMKGLSPGVTIHSGRDRAFRYWLSQMATFRLRPSGIVRCRFRAGVSRNIDREARQGYRNCGFASRFVRGATTPAELFTDAYLREFENEAQLAAMEATQRAMCPPGFSLSSL